MSDALAVSGFEGDGAAWDTFVAGAEGSTFCHLAGWRDIMGDVLGHECRYLVVHDASGRWHGVLPLVRVKSPLLGHYLVSMPFLNAGGPLGTAAAGALLAEHAQADARRHGVDLLELRAREVVASSLRVTQRKVTVLLELPSSANELWAALPAPRRRQIRHAGNEGLETRFGADELEAFYEVFARNMRDLGTPVLPRGLFARIATVFPHRVVFGAVYRGEQPLAAGCGFVWRDEFELTWVSALREHRASAANMLLYASFMQRMIDRGVRVFNFGRSTPGSGPHQFKRQWGGRDVPLPWQQWSPRNVTATPSPERPMFRVATAVWRRLPLGLANRLGPVIARQIP